MPRSPAIQATRRSLSTPRRNRFDTLGECSKPSPVAAECAKVGGMIRHGPAGPRLNLDIAQPIDKIKSHPPSPPTRTWGVACVGRTAGVVIRAQRLAWQIKSETFRSSFWSAFGPVSG